MRTFALAPLIALLAGSASAQTTVTLQSDRDATLYESPTGDLANGAGGSLFTGTTNASLSRHAVLHFDVAGAVPSGATITSASLTVNVEMITPGSTTSPQSLHVIDQDWGEGTTVAMGTGGGGGASTNDSATWIHTFFPGSTWTNPGGDFAAAPSAGTDLDVLGLHTFASADLALDAQSMLDDPAGNFGWLLRADAVVTGSSRRLSSRESGNMANRPVLTIEYTLGGLGLDYCGPAVGNSSGGPAVLAATGSATAADNDLTLTATGVPANQFGYLLLSQTQGFVMQPGMSQGNLCLGGSIGRFIDLAQTSDVSGTLTFAVDPSMVPQPSSTAAIQSGETWNFQAWFRDMNPASTSNFTQGLSILFD